MSESGFEWRPHGPKQSLAIESPKPIVVLASGIQFGKTTVGAVKMCIALHEFTDPTDNFLIVAPTYKILHQSTLPPFFRLMDGRGEFSKGEEKFVMHGGGTCYFRTATDPDSIVGITNVRLIWGDEAGLFGLYFFENIQARAAFKQAQVILTTSPYALNWLYKDIILPKMKNPGARPDVELNQAASNENPYFPDAEYQRRKLTMDPRRFNMMFGGRWDKMEGLVYDCFSIEENVCEPFTLPAGTRYYGGIDWGHTDPFVLTVRAVTPSGAQFQVAEFYKTQMTISDMIEEARRKMSVWGIERFICGPDRPENIMEFNRAGLPAIPARNEVLLGIDTHYELIKSRRYKIFAGTSPYTLDEIEKYHWPSEEEIDTDKDHKERNPVKQDDHAMDSCRYLSLTLSAKASGQRRSPKQQEEKPVKTIYDRINELKRGRRITERGYKWD